MRLQDWGDNASICWPHRWPFDHWNRGLFSQGRVWGTAGVSTGTSYDWLATCLRSTNSWFLFQKTCFSLGLQFKFSIKWSEFLCFKYNLFINCYRALVLHQKSPSIVGADFALENDLLWRRPVVMFSKDVCGYCRRWLTSNILVSAYVAHCFFF